jgi:hypothetical protein
MAIRAAEVNPAARSKCFFIRCFLFSLRAGKQRHPRGSGNYIPDVRLVAPACRFHGFNSKCTGLLC